MTSRIAILPSAVADQIAAGEVVERPASVVKELLENALDAGATAVDIAVTEGGRVAIRVSDDGTGMSRDDAVLALSRHATSKIHTAADLVGVRSFGFRGEALPAICSVSEMEIETADGDGAGTLVRAAAGSVEAVSEAARRRGTTVTVQRLFYNAPARQKFLRGARSEWRGILELVTTAALVRRDVRLTLTHDDKPVLTLPPAATLRARLAALHGVQFAERLLDVNDLSGPIHVSGLVERPADVGLASRRVHLTVNGRAVRDNGLLRAAETAYRSTIPHGVRPTLFLDIVLPGDAVDVNVHPAKAEVRFRDRWTVERAVENAVRRALGTFEAGGAFGRVAPPLQRPWETQPSAVDSLPATDQSASSGKSAIGFFADADIPADGSTAATDKAAPQSEPDRDADIPPLTQLRRTYLMFEHEDGVFLIDQHSAHERILFEKFLTAISSGEPAGQRLLFPLTLHLDPAEADAFDAHRDLFEGLGFEIEGFGGATLIVRAVPMPHPRFDAERCLRETLHALTGAREASSSARHERLAATIACKAAIKAGDVLAPSEMRALFIALRDTTLPAHDVHGRATIVRLGWDELERRFGRR